MEINENLMRTIQGRVIELVTKEEGLVAITFNDHSTMRVEVAGSPTLNMLIEGRIESVAEDGPELILLGDEGRTAVLRLADPGGVRNGYGVRMTESNIQDEATAQRI